jgi:hypothetical protein
MRSKVLRGNKKKREKLSKVSLNKKEAMDKIASLVIR